MGEWGGNLILIMGPGEGGLPKTRNPFYSSSIFACLFPGKSNANWFFLDNTRAPKRTPSLIGNPSLCPNANAKTHFPIWEKKKGGEQVSITRSEIAGEATNLKFRQAQDWVSYFLSFLLTFSWNKVVLLFSPAVRHTQKNGHTHKKEDLYSRSRLFLSWTTWRVSKTPWHPIHPSFLPSNIARGSFLLHYSDVYLSVFPYIYAGKSVKKVWKKAFPLWSPPPTMTAVDFGRGRWFNLLGNVIIEKEWKWMENLLSHTLRNREFELFIKEAESKRGGKEK